MTDFDAQLLDRERQLKALRSLIQRATHLAQVERILLMIERTKDGRLTAIDPTGDFPEAEIQKLHVPRMQGLSGEVFHTGRPQVILDTARDGRGDVGLLRGVGAKNVLAVPIVYRRRDEGGDVVSETTIGVLHAINKRQGSFDSHDQQILSILGSQATQLLAHTHLYEWQVEGTGGLIDAFESMPVGVIAINAEGLLFEVNEQMEVLGIRREEVGRHYRDVFQKATQFLAGIVEEVYRTRKSSGMELQLTTTNGQGKEEPRNFRIQVDPITNPNSRGNGFGGAVVVLQDTTSEREDEQLQESFVSTISHDLRTPLTVIQGFVDTLLMAYADGMPFDEETTHEFLTMIGHNSHRMLRLVNDVLVLTRLTKGLPLELSLHPYALRPSIEMMVESQRSLTPMCQFEVEIPDDLPDVTADQERIEQVIGNLLHNAAKYSPNGGTILTKVTLENGMITVRVKDQGIGIPPEALKKMFGRLFRVESEKHKGIKGTGLGLYLCKELIRLHGGEIGVESEYGHGSTFYFTIPLLGPQQNS